MLTWNEIDMQYLEPLFNEDIESLRKKRYQYEPIFAPEYSHELLTGVSLSNSDGQIFRLLLIF